FSTWEKNLFRRYQTEFLKYGFVCTVKIEYQCVVCSEVLAHESLKPTKLKRHLETKHSTYKDKPLDFFQRKAKELRCQKTVVTEYATVPAKALAASYEVAQSKKAHTIAESLIRPAVAMTRAMHGEKISQTLLTIPLSNDTMGRRIQDMAIDMKDQLIERVRENGRFSLQIDESTDLSGAAQLLTFIRYAFEGKMHHDLLFCSAMEGKCTGRDIFTQLDSDLEKAGLRWASCVSVCTDGAAAMQGSRKGYKACVLEVAPHVTFLHCMIHREALASKCLEPELRNVFQTSVKMVNFIKARPVQSRLFAQLCHEMGSEHEALLFHTDVRWLSRGKVLTRLFELREEVRIFLSDCGSPLAEHLSDPKWVASLAYLASIFDRLNILNASLQGPNANVLTLSDKITAFKRKLERWAVRMDEGCADMFPELDDFMDSYDISIGALKNVISSHLRSLCQSFNKYFPQEDAPEIHDWIRDPFASSNAPHLPSELQDALLELSSDRTLQSSMRKSLNTECRQLSVALASRIRPSSCFSISWVLDSILWLKSWRHRKSWEDDTRIRKQTTADNRNGKGSTWV
uniref:DUF4371 domain-containing protein n=1 Tax=Neogobius melanostomus TaxID=47308 RepID=A0A8C6S3X4_9GOBI